MAIKILKVSENTFNEIANALDNLGIKVNPEENITLSKDTAIKGPVDWRHVQVKRDILPQIAAVYKPKMTEDGTICITDSLHFINFFDDCFNYVMKGDKPKDNTPTITATITSITKDKDTKKW